MRTSGVRWPVWPVIGMVLTLLLGFPGSPAVASNAAACGWRVVKSPNPGQTDHHLYGISALSPSNIWAVGIQQASQTLVVHWNGAKWSIVASPNVPGGTNQLNDVDALSPTSIWAVGFHVKGSAERTLIEHFDGKAWHIVSSPNAGTGDNDLAGVAAVSGSNVWAVGSTPEKTLVEHWNGAKWLIVSTPTITGHSSLADVSATAAADVWAVGQQQDVTLIERFDGTHWAIVPSPNAGTGQENELTGVSAVSTKAAWAVGSHALATGVRRTLSMRWDGSNWAVVGSPNVGTHDNRLAKVSALSAGSAWAVGLRQTSSFVDQTLTEQFKSGSWGVASSPNIGTEDNELADVAMLTGTNAWAVGTSRANRILPGTLIEHFSC